MPNKVLSMLKLRELLRLKFSQKLTHRQIAKSLHVSSSTVSDYSQAAKATGLAWETLNAMDEATLQGTLAAHMGIKVDQADATAKVPIDCLRIHQELKHKGVTMELLWQEYRSNAREHYSYSQFCRIYKKWLKHQPQSMRQVHQAGEKMFLDYSGMKMPITDPETGEIKYAEIFVAVLGCSNYTYAEASWSQQLPDWLASQRRAFEYFGGVTALLIPDNLKPAINKACHYEPDVNETYAEFVAYYQTAVLPARPYSPKDKAKVEVAVQIVQRWILAKLRHEVFYSLDALNQRIAQLLEEFNHRPFKKLPGTRKAIYKELDLPALKPLPAKPYEYAQRKKAKVHVDYHIEVHGHYYSVPYTLIGKVLTARITQKTIEIFDGDKRVDSHARGYKKGGFSTKPLHMPTNHRGYSQWSEERFINWGKKIGPAAVRLVKAHMSRCQHPEQGYRACLGLLSLSRNYGEQRLEKACQMAIDLNAMYRATVANILKNNRDKLSSDLNNNKSQSLGHHENIRGAAYYGSTEIKGDNHVN